MAEQRLEILRSRLGPLSEREWQTIASQLRSLAQEIALEPTLRLKRESGEEGDGLHYDLLTATRELFGLQPETVTESFPDSASADDSGPENGLYSDDAPPAASCIDENAEADRTTAEAHL
jgi:hypothetical protein